MKTKKYFFSDREDYSKTDKKLKQGDYCKILNRSQLRTIFAIEDFYGSSLDGVLDDWYRGNNNEVIGDGIAIYDVSYFFTRFSLSETDKFNELSFEEFVTCTKNTFKK